MGNIVDKVIADGQGLGLVSRLKAEEIDAAANYQDCRDAGDD